MRGVRREYFVIQVEDDVNKEGDFVPSESATNAHTVFCSRNTLAYTDTSNKTMFVIPANAVIIDWWLDITTLFNGTTPQIVVGTTSADPDEYVDDIAAGTAGMNRCGDASDMPDSGRGSVGTSAITVLGKFKVAGGTPSQGAATFEMLWTLR